MANPVIASACRTAIGRFQGALASLGAVDLGGVVIKEALARASISGDIVDEVIMGCVLQAGLGQNPARQAARKGGVPDSVGSMTINKVCGSGLKAVALAAQAIRAGDAEVIVAGGMESMSRAPYLLPAARDGLRLGHGQVLDVMVHDGLWDAYKNFHMGMTGELVAEKYGISRQAQDEFAAMSHAKAVSAQKAGKFKKEIVAVSVAQRKGEPIVVDSDEGPRADSTVESLSRLKPAFKPNGGTVTAGNASSINDGASALVVMSEARARKVGAPILASILGYAVGGTAPEWVMIAPVEAWKKLHSKLGTTNASFGLFEFNEPFAAASIAVVQECGLDPRIVNVHGGAIALGHPIGATGARILTTLLHAMIDRDVKRGAANLCLGGGNAVALAIER
ncbi:MAG: acetyl-CoA C-acetyltransferase [Planctomycetota bacterium]